MNINMTWTIIIISYALSSVISTAYALKHLSYNWSLFYSRSHDESVYIITMFFGPIMILSCMADAIQLYWNNVINIFNIKKMLQSKKIISPDPQKDGDYYWWDIVLYWTEYAMIAWYIPFRDSYYILVYGENNTICVSPDSITRIERPKSEMQEELQLCKQAQELKKESDKFEMQSKELLNKAKDIQIKAVKLRKNNLFISK